MSERFIVTTARDATSENHSEVKSGIDLAFRLRLAAALCSAFAPWSLGLGRALGAEDIWESFPTAAVVMKCKAVSEVGYTKWYHDMTALFTMMRPTLENTFMLHAPALESAAGSFSMAPGLLARWRPMQLASQISILKGP